MPHQTAFLLFWHMPLLLQPKPLPFFLHLVQPLRAFFLRLTAHSMLILFSYSSSNPPILLIKAPSREQAILSENALMRSFFHCLCSSSERNSKFSFCSLLGELPISVMEVEVDGDGNSDEAEKNDELSEPEA